jgi:4-amino-4-deoxy-L-arabinose transferase-like glycosyltransferase
VFFDRRLRLATLLLLCYFTFGLGLGRQAITDADEAFYAEASREMVESGDWLTPKFNYQNRWEKPVLYYWLTSASYLVIGPTEFAARLWAALSGVGLVLLAWGISRHMTGRDDVAWLSGAVVATSFGYFSMARSALPDLPLTFCITLGIWATLRAVDATGPRSVADELGSAGPSAFATATADRHSSKSGGWFGSAVVWWALAGFGAGAGFLMKGPVALVVPAVVLLPIAWRERRRVKLDARGIALAVVIGALVGLPWYVAMWREHGSAYLQSFFVGDNLQRFSTERFNDARPFWFYLPVLLGGLMPWSVYLVAFSADSVARLRRGTLRLSDTDWRLLIWAAMPVLFFTISIGKQPRYILPILPPLAIFVARGIIERLGHRRDRLLAAATWITAIIYAVLAVAFVRMEPLLNAAYPLATWMGVCLLGCSGILLAGVVATSSWRRLPLAATIAGVLVLLSVWFGALAGNRPEPVEQMAAMIHSHRSAQEPIGVLDVFTRNLGFYTGAPRMQLYGTQQASIFLHSPERVLLVLRSADVPAVAAASGLTLKTLGEVRYLNTANIRLRTLLRPDPTMEIETISLVTNR